MDSITFKVGEIVIEMADDEITFWDSEASIGQIIILPIKELQNALSTASMLRKQ